MNAPGNPFTAWRLRSRAIMRAMPTQDWFERLMGFRERDDDLTGSWFVARSKPSNPMLMM
jgi:hypothetical protein